PVVVVVAVVVRSAFPPLRFWWPPGPGTKSRGIRRSAVHCAQSRSVGSP
ncbi:hypothetical protein CEXT_452361, partial [Caerostris extrusa]